MSKVDLKEVEDGGEEDESTTEEDDQLKVQFEEKLKEDKLKEESKEALDRNAQLVYGADTDDDDYEADTDDD